MSKVQFLINHFWLKCREINESFVVPFRVGDIVRVNDWGKTFSDSKTLYINFTNSSETPYYSTKEGRLERSNSIHFKIIGLCFFYGNIVAYIKDRQGQGATIDINGLTLVKQFPLRIGERIVKEIKNVGH